METAVALAWFYFAFAQYRKTRRPTTSAGPAANREPVHRSCTLRLVRYARPAAKGDTVMKLGVFTPVFGNRTLDQVLKKMRSLPGVSAIELATGGWPGSAHVDVNGLLANPHKAAEF